MGFEHIPPGTDIGGTSIGGATFLVGNTPAPSAPLSVVAALDTFTPAGFSGAPNPSTNKLIATTGSKVLSPGGTRLAPGPNATVENDDVLITFATPVRAVAFDVLFQSLDCCSYAAVTVRNASGAVLYWINSIPSGSSGGGGQAGGTAFVGFVSSATDIKSVLFNDRDGDATHPDANFGIDSVRFGSPPSSGITPEESDALLARYVPELRFPRDESYRADSAALATALYFDDPNDEHTNFLRRPGVPGPIAAADPTPSTGPFGLLTLDYLNASAQTGDYLSQPTFYFGDAILSARNDYSQWVAQRSGYQHYTYGRVVPDPAGTGAKIVQYWMYYYYNPMNTLGIGKHEGDWEWVQVRLSPSGVPQVLSYSQHGHPEACEWGEYPTQYTAMGRPIVYVAIDSHANYFWQGSHPYNFDGLANGLDNTWDDGPEFYVTPSIVNVTNDPPRWIATWDGYWGDSFGEVKSPRSPGFQPSWSDPWGWEHEPQAVTCTEPVDPPSSAMQRQRQAGGRQISTQAEPAPALPRIVRTRILRGTRYGTAVKVSYCFASLPKNPWRRPWRLQLTIENLRDSLPPLGHAWPVKKRCDSVTHPVGGIRPPYLLRYSVQSKRGTWSRRAQIRVRS